VRSAAASLFGRCHRLAFCKSLCVLKRILRFSGRLSLSYIVFDFSGHSCKSRLYVSALLSRCLKEADSIMVGHLLTFFERNSSFVFQVSLVSDQNASDVILSVLFDLTHPSVDGVESVAVSDVIDDNDAVRSFVVAGCNCLESLLPCRIPYLQLAYLLIHIDRADFEVHSNRRHKVFLELVVLLHRLTISITCKKMSSPKESRLLTANLSRRQDFPTPEFPIISTLKR